MTQTLKRLELIQTAIALDDEEIVEMQIAKLEALASDDEVAEILQKLESLEYASALTAIENYLVKYHMSTFDVLKDLSIETWERIGFARTRKGLKIYETTITQNILYSLAKKLKTSKIEMYEATNEKINGNDMEICLKTKKGYILLPTQSKILYMSGKYDKINHGNQIENLIKYAKSVGGIPLHLFYNYDNSHADSEYGCTIIETKKLLSGYKSSTGSCKIRALKYKELHTGSGTAQKARPWHNFLCLLPTMPHKDIDSVEYYRKKEILKDDEWKQVSIVDSNMQRPVDSNSNYAPKFRIMFDLEKIHKD